MFSRVWSSAGYEPWREMLIFIEALLGDEQGLSMGERLTVNLRQPSHEFTFSVVIDLISNPLVLTPLI
jgi:hypothetical protein